VQVQSGMGEKRCRRERRRNEKAKHLSPSAKRDDARDSSWFECLWLRHPLLPNEVPSDFTVPRSVGL
jgi:hypothetical protein